MASNSHDRYPTTIYNEHDSATHQGSIISLYIYNATPILMIAMYRICTLYIVACRDMQSKSHDPTIGKAPIKFIRDSRLVHVHTVAKHLSPHMNQGEHYTISLCLV